MPQFLIIFAIFAASAAGFIAFNKASIDKALAEAHQESIMEGYKVNDAIRDSADCVIKLRDYRDLIECLKNDK